MSRSLFKRESTLALLALTILAAASTLAQISSSNTACTRHYVVEDGDTCDKIGQKTLTSTYQVMALNLPEAGTNCYTLQIGAQLCLGTYGNDCQMVHRATNNDDCSKIASQYNITQGRLRNNNPNLNCDQVYDGLMLCVIPGIIRPTSNSALNLSYVSDEESTNTVAAAMPLGTAIVATNAVEAGPQVVQTVTVPASATKATATASAASKRHNHLDSRNGHGHGHHHHQAAAKRYQASHGDVTSDSL